VGGRGRVGDHLHPGAPRAEAGQAEHGGHVHVLREVAHGLDGRALVDDGGASDGVPVDRVLLEVGGVLDGDRRLGGDQLDRVQAGDGGRLHRVEPAQRAGGDVDAAAGAAGGLAHLLVEGFVGERTDAHDHHVHAGLEHGDDVLAGGGLRSGLDDEVEVVARQAAHVGGVGDAFDCAVGDHVADYDDLVVAGLARAHRFDQVAADGAGPDHADPHGCPPPTAITAGKLSATAAPSSGRAGQTAASLLL